MMVFHPGLCHVPVRGRRGWGHQCSVRVCMFGVFRGKGLTKIELNMGLQLSVPALLKI